MHEKGGLPALTRGSLRPPTPGRSPSAACLCISLPQLLLLFLLIPHQKENPCNALGGCAPPNSTLPIALPHPSADGSRLCSEFASFQGSRHHSKPVLCNSLCLPDSTGLRLRREI